MLVSNWKDAWKWYSVHAAAVQGLLAATQTAMALYGSPLMSAAHFSVAMIGFAVAIPILRVLGQGGTD